jgi:hypothetical protein
MTNEETNYNTGILKKAEATPKTSQVSKLNKQTSSVPKLNLSTSSELKLIPLKPITRGYASNPFNNLPQPNAGDRIKSSDFQQLSKCLEIIYDAYAFSASFFGRDFGEAKLALTSQQYVIHGAMTVFGTEITDLNDESLDTRKVIQVIPSELGGIGVVVVLTEAIETRRLTPNFVEKPHTYMDALETIRTIVGDATFPSASISAPDLKGFTLKQAKDMF